MKIVLLSTMLILLMSVPALASQPSILQPDLQSLQQFISGIQGEWQHSVPHFTLQDLLENIKQGQSFNWRELVKILIRYFFSEVVAASNLLGRLLVLVVFGALLKNLAQGFPVQDAAKVAESMLFLAMVILAIQSYQLALQAGKTSIANMVSLMQSLLPVIFTMTMAGGSLSGASVLYPFLLATVTTLGTLCEGVIFPLLYLSATLGLVTHVIPEVNVGRLGSFVSGLCITLLGLVLCAFAGIGTVQGATSRVVDGMTVRSVKFLSASFVPVVGKLFSDALEAVIGYSSILRTAVSTMGMVLMLLVCSFPMLKILVLVLVYKLAAALAEPIADQRMTQCLAGLGNSMALLFAAVGVVALLCFLSLASLIGLGNLPWGRGV